MDVVTAKDMQNHVDTFDKFNLYALAYILMIAMFSLTMVCVIRSSRKRMTNEDIRIASNSTPRRNSKTT